MQAQNIDDGVFNIMRGNRNGPVFNIGVLLVAPDGLDTNGVALIAPRQHFNLARHRRREQQGLAGLRRGIENKFKVLAKTEIEHFIGLVEHDRTQLRQIKAAALKVIAQTAGRANNDMRALVQLTRFRTGVHAADAGDDARAGVCIKPRQFALDLQSQFTRRRDDQRQRRSPTLETFKRSQQGRRHGQSKRDCLARAGLRRHQQIAVGGVGVQHRHLHGGRNGIVARGKRTCERGMCRRECHGTWGLCQQRRHGLSPGSGPGKHGQGFELKRS